MFCLLRKNTGLYYYRFGEKEEYMLFMNEFLEQHWEPMRGFLQKVSDPESEIAMARFDGYVDLPLRLAILHSLLVDIICPMKQVTDFFRPSLSSLIIRFLMFFSQI